MDLQDNLEQLGLSKNQAKVYLANLQLGAATVLNLAKYADLKRPTVYLILEDLEKLGLVSKTKDKRNKTLFKAEKPKRLLTDLRVKEELVNEMLPSLNAIYNLDPEKPHIKIAEGVSGVRSVYNGIFTYLAANPSEELLIYGSLGDAQQLFGSQVVDLFQTLMKQSKNPIREIGNDDHETRKYYRESAALNPHHELRMIRNDGRFFKTDNMIYGNTVVIFSVKDQIFATTIEASNIVETYKTLFNMAWRSGKRV